MVELIFRSVSKIMHANWLLNGPRLRYWTGPILSSFRTGTFCLENLRNDFNKIEGKLSIYIEKL